MFNFTKAVKYGSKLRLALIGTSGSGKTYSALSIATGLGGKIAFIDTEHGSARKYSDVFDFDVIEFDSFAVENFLMGIKSAEKAGYDVLIIDSLSHAWSGKDGILEFVDARTESSKSKNAYVSGWRDATPLHNSLIDTILASKMHIIACMRSKTEYVMQDDPRTGKKSPVKIGMQPVQRDGMEYEFDVIGDMTMEHKLVVGKTRCPKIDGKVFNMPGAELAAILLEWVGGAAAPESVPSSRVQSPSSPVKATPPAPRKDSLLLPEDSPALNQARERLSAVVKAMYVGRLGGFGDIAVMTAAVKDALGVDKIANCNDLLALNTYADELEKFIATSDAPFSEPGVQADQVVDPVALQLPEMNETFLEIDKEIMRRSIPESVADGYTTSAMTYAEEGKTLKLASILDAVRTYPLLPPVATDDVANLQKNVKDCLMNMVTNQIDHFEQSKRLTASLNEWLGVKKVADCVDAEKLAAYALHLHSIIQSQEAK